MSRISVVMATCNGSRYLDEQIRSVLSQSHSDLELIICDDASDDDSFELCQRYVRQDPRVRAWHNPARVGVKENFRRALAHAGSERVAFCDQDDVWSTRKLERLSDLMDRNAAVQLAYSDLVVCNDRLEPLARSFWKWSHTAPFRGRLGERAFLRNFIPGCSMLISRRVANALLLVSPEIPFLHDHLSLVLASGLGRIDYTAEPLVCYRQHSQNQIGTGVSTFDPERFIRDLISAVRCVRGAHIDGLCLDLRRVEGFAQAYLRTRGRARYADLFMYLHGWTPAEQAKGLAECLLPSLYHTLKGR